MALLPVAINFSHNEKDLLVRLSSGDESAFKTLMRAYWNTVYSLAMTYLKSPEMAEEALHDVFLKVWDKRAQLSGVEKFDAWLFIIARNHILSGLRKKLALPRQDVLSSHLQDSLIPQEEGLRPDRLLESSQALRLIERGIALLPERRRTIFLLSRREELSYEEIAQRLQISKAAVKGQIALSLNFLREYLAGHSDLLLLIAVYGCSR